LSLSASEKTIKSKEESSLFEVENALTPKGIKPFVEKAYFLGGYNNLRDLTLYKLNLSYVTDLLVEFLTKNNIIRSQLYPFFKGIYKLCPLI